MNAYISNIKKIFSLGFQLSKAEFKLKNEGSYLGVLWYLVNPILTFVLLYLIFLDRLGDNIQYYSLYLLLAIIMFNFFQSVTLESTKSIIKEYQHIIKSINFPREALILSILIKNTFSHVIEFILFCIIFFFINTNYINLLFYIPILILFGIFIYGFSLILSSLTVYFVDLDNIWNFLVKLIWFGTPIFYTLGGQNRLFMINHANPLYYYITLARDLIIYNKFPEIWIIVVCFVFSLFFFLAGMFIFAKLKHKMAELI